MVSMRRPFDRAWWFSSRSLQPAARRRGTRSFVRRCAPAVPTCARPRLRAVLPVDARALRAQGRAPAGVWRDRDRGGRGSTQPANRGSSFDAWCGSSTKRCPLQGPTTRSRSTTGFRIRPAAYGLRGRHRKLGARSRSRIDRADMKVAASGVEHRVRIRIPDNACKTTFLMMLSAGCPRRITRLHFLVCGFR